MSWLYSTILSTENTVNYEEAEPLIREESAFRLEVADKKASFLPEGSLRAGSRSPWIH